MPLYGCEQCGARENTALGHYWLRNEPDHFDWSGIEDRRGKALCSECAPPKHADGSRTDWGVWHGVFQKVPFYKG